KEPIEERTTELAKRNAALRIENQVRLQTEQRLKHAVSLVQATLDATADGILVVSREGKVTSYNRRFLEMWGVSSAVASGKEDAELLELVLPKLENSKEFLNKVRDLYARREATSFDVIHLKDGRIFERYSQPQCVERHVVGRVW